MDVFRPEVKMVSTGTLEGAAFNPDSRTDKAKIKGLVEGIREVGGIVQPIIASKDWKVIDGHRRLAAAKALGLKEVPVIVSPLSLQVGWRVLNDSTLKIASKDWVQAHYSGMSLENLPKNHQRKIKKIKKLIGEKGFERVAEAGMSSNVVNEARYIAKYIEGRHGTRQHPSDAMHREVLLWMIECGQQAHAKAAVKNEMDPEALEFFVRKRKMIHGK